MNNYYKILNEIAATFDMDQWDNLINSAITNKIDTEIEAGPLYSDFMEYLENIMCSLKFLDPEKNVKDKEILYNILIFVYKVYHNKIDDDCKYSIEDYDKIFTDNLSPEDLNELACNGFDALLQWIAGEYNSKYYWNPYDWSWWDADLPSSGLTIYEFFCSAKLQNTKKFQTLKNYLVDKFKYTWDKKLSAPDIWNIIQWVCSSEF